MAGCVTCGSYSNTVADFLFWGDTLFAVGNYNRMGGAIGSGLAKWYDNEWCMLAPEG
ncbi:MAG: hypothetical protein IPL52_13420 [Flavobacteriales bacterium]|nr:hypothetical protein [Flavobacteriales bacterium]